MSENSISTLAFAICMVPGILHSLEVGAIRVMQAVLPSMRRAGSGLVINCSSLVGRMSPPFFGTYTATKHALEGYSQALRYEVSPFGVDIVMVEPGPFGTGLLASGQIPGVDEINDLTQPIQDSVLKEMQLDSVLGGVSA